MVNPRLILDAHCRIDEPTPARQHYVLALLWTTSTDRRWRIELSLRIWAAQFPRLIVSDWEDTESALVGMRWGVRATKRLLPGILCFGNALRGRYDWLAVLDDDTAVDASAMIALTTVRLAHLKPILPWLLSFAPQPMPPKPDITLGCNGARKWKRRAVPCTGEQIPFNTSKENMGAAWPYGGVGFLLSAGAIGSIWDSDFDDAPKQPPSPHGRLIRGQRGVASFGRMQADSRSSGVAHACLRELTCPWGAEVACESLPPPFNGSAGDQIDRTGFTTFSGFCSRRTASAHKAQDCRVCSGTDVSISCCLASRGIFVTHINGIDSRIRPDRRGLYYWTPWAAHLGGMLMMEVRDNASYFEATMRKIIRCGLRRGPHVVHPKFREGSTMVGDGCDS